VIVLAVVLVVIALAVVVFAVLLAAAALRMRRRTARHDGTYLVDGSPRTFDSAAAARAFAVEELVAERLAGPVRVLARCTDGGWDVVDEVDVLG
jgi:hypothetical protein